MASGSPLHLVNEKQGENFSSFYGLQGREKKLKFEALVPTSVFLLSKGLIHISYSTSISNMCLPVSVESTLLTQPSWSFGGSQVGPQCYCSQ
jgi:hypothetical protein